MGTVVQIDHLKSWNAKLTEKNKELERIAELKEKVDANSGPANAQLESRSSLQSECLVDTLIVYSGWAGEVERLKAVNTKLTERNKELEGMTDLQQGALKSVSTIFHLLGTANSLIRIIGNSSSNFQLQQNLDSLINTQSASATLSKYLTNSLESSQRREKELEKTVANMEKENARLRLRCAIVVEKGMQGDISGRVIAGRGGEKIVARLAFF